MYKTSRYRRCSKWVQHLAVSAENLTVFRMIISKIAWLSGSIHVGLWLKICFQKTQNMSTRLMLLGDEAIAQAGIDAGMSGIYAYPGTPSTEITEYVMNSRDA